MSVTVLPLHLARENARNKHLEKLQGIIAKARAVSPEAAAAIDATRVDVGHAVSVDIPKLHEFVECLTLQLQSMHAESLLEDARRAKLAGALGDPSSAQHYVKVTCSETLTFPAVELSESVEDLKRYVQYELNIPADKHVLFFHGRKLEENRTLQDYGIQYGETIFVALRLRGGMYHGSSGMLDSMISNEPVLHGVMFCVHSMVLTERGFHIAEGPGHPVAVDIPKSKCSFRTLIEAIANSCVKEAHGMEFEPRMVAQFPDGRRVEMNGLPDEHIWTILCQALRSDCVWGPICPACNPASYDVGKAGASPIICIL